MSHNIQHFADATALANGAAEAFVRLSNESIAARGRFTVALSGGSTPRTLHQVLATDHQSDVDWSRVHIFWGDERPVPPDHRDSNYRMAKETLLDAVPVPPANVHRIKGELPPDEAAADYARVLSQQFADSMPRFDLIFLGMGGDGHTASLFPWSPAIEETHRPVVANPVSEVVSNRITLTIPAINAARAVIFLVSGAHKAAMLKLVVRGPRRPREYPAQFINPDSGTLTWYVDRAAASQL